LGAALSRPKGAKDLKPRLPKRGPRHLHVLSDSQALALVRTRAALKQAQRERAALAETFKYFEVSDNDIRPVILTERQTALVAELQRAICAAQTALRAIEKSTWAHAGNWRHSGLRELSASDLHQDPWAVFVQVKQLRTENRRLHQLVQVHWKLGRPRLGDD